MASVPVSAMLQAVHKQGAAYTPNRSLDAELVLSLSLSLCWQSWEDR